MKEYYLVNNYARNIEREEKEIELLNIYANLYAKHINDNEKHIYQHIHNNQIDTASVSELEQHINMLKEHIYYITKGENDGEHEQL